MTDVVAVIRLHNGDDLIAIIAGEMDNKLRVEHPYYIRYNPAQGAVGMVPYCALSDEIFFQIDRSKIDFIAVANNDISDKFLKMIDSVDQLRHTQAMEDDEPYDKLEAAIVHKTFIEGNDTKH